MSVNDAFVMNAWAKDQKLEYVKPEVGTMLMFPAWLRHGVMPFFGEGERRTFSCNMNVSPTEILSGDHYRKTREE